MANLQKSLNNKKVKLRRSARIRRVLQRQNPPELCLDAIFRQIPLEHLLLDSTELISKSWHAARTRALAKRQTLYILRDKTADFVPHLSDNAPYKDHVCSLLKREDGSFLNPEVPLGRLRFDALYLPTGKLTVKLTTKLLCNLPKITHLVVLANGGGMDTQELEQVIRLLTHHSAHLVKLHLSLSDNIGQQIEPLAITHLIETINRLAVLEHLKLNLDITVAHERPPLSILSRLSSFWHDSVITLFEYVANGSEWLSSSLRQYATNSATLRSIGTEGLELRQLDRLEAQLVGKFNWLEVSDDQGEEIEYAQMLQLFARFNSLTSLDLSYGVTALPINMLARCLAQVPSLIYLSLSISNQATEPTIEGEPIIQYQVPSVLELHLCTRFDSHEKVKCLNIGYTFPHLQVFQIQQIVQGCSSCPFETKRATFKKVVQCTLNSSVRQ